MNRVIKYTGLLVIVWLLGIKGFAQTIRGTVSDSAGKAIPYATVSLKNTTGNAIVTYTVTDVKGAYVLTLPANITTQGLYVEARSLGYKTQTKDLANVQATANFILPAAANELQAIIVKSLRPILRANGDTLGYRVSEFAGPQDRVIGDVIKKLPGITVAADGTIMYNNKPVIGVYIGGDNLLDDRYSIATTTIPQSAVDEVQVIQNVQPIKVLQNKVVSDDVALNLTFKKNAKLQMVGQESFGAGVPGNYDVDLNAMMFKDGYKAINYLQGNNTGNDIQQTLAAHNFSSYMDRVDNNVPATVLSLGTVNTPGLDLSRYLFNQSGIINLNNLVHIEKDVQLKINAWYFHDRQLQDYSQNTTIFLPGDTVKYNETQHNRFRPDVLHTQLTLNINREKYYLNDILLMDDNRSASYSNLVTNGSAVNQVFNDDVLQFSNEFNLMKTFKSNNIVEAYSYISHSAEPENRTIGNDYNASIFNNNIPYDLLLQNVNVPAWFTNNYLSYKVPYGLITQSFKAGFDVQSQTLTSALNVMQNNKTTTPESDSSVNHLNWLKEKVYAEAEYDLLGSKLKGNLILPLSLQQINYSDSLYSLNKELTRLYFNPRLQLKYQTSTENFFTFQYSYRNQIGTIEDVYPGYILKDYRTLYANNANLTESQNQQAALGFNYRKTITLFFFTLNAAYNHITSNNIASEVVNNNLQQQIMLPYPNSTDSWTLSSTISKYSFPLKTTFSAGLTWQSNKSVQLQNSALLPFDTYTETAYINANTKINQQLNFSYKATGTETYSHSSVDGSAFHIDQLVQTASIYYNPSDYWQFNLSGEHYFTYQQGNPGLKYFFADASAKWRVKKWRTDIELSAVNMLNVKTYNQLYLTANMLTASSYSLPGRIVMLKFYFNL